LLIIIVLIFQISEIVIHRSFRSGVRSIVSEEVNLQI
jgi:hypothetical protein